MLGTHIPFLSTPESTQAQTLERSVSRSSTDVGHNDQFKNGDPGEVKLILLDLATWVAWAEIPLLAHNLSNERPPSGDHRKTNSWVRCVSVSTNAVNVNQAGVECM